MQQSPTRAWLKFTTLLIAFRCPFMKKIPNSYWPTLNSLYLPSVRNYEFSIPYPRKLGLRWEINVSWLVGERALKRTSACYPFFPCFLAYHPACFWLYALFLEAKPSDDLWNCPNLHHTWLNHNLLICTSPFAYNSISAMLDSTSRAQRSDNLVGSCWYISYYFLEYNKRQFIGPHGFIISF